MKSFKFSKNVHLTKIKLAFRWTLFQFLFSLVKTVLIFLKNISQDLYFHKSTHTFIHLFTHSLVSRQALSKECSMKLYHQGIFHYIPSYYLPIPASPHFLKQESSKNILLSKSKHPMVRKPETSSVPTEYCFYPNKGTAFPV